MMSTDYTSRKLPKIGKRCGLFKFIRVDDQDRLLQKLQSIWIINFKLFTSIARFHREEGKHKVDDGGWMER